MKHKVLVACEIFADELRTVLNELPPVRVIWLEAALHADLERLELAIKKALSECSNSSEILLLYGVGCLPGIDELLRQHNARRIQMRNCIEAFLGEELEKLEEQKTFILTPGWVRAWPQIMATMGWDAVDVRMNFGRYSKILLFDPGIRPLVEDEILSFFDLTGVYIDPKPLELGRFRTMIEKFLLPAGTFA